MKTKFKTARIVVAVTPEELKDVKLLASARFLSISAAVRQILCEQARQLKKSQVKEQAA